MIEDPAAVPLEERLPGNQASLANRAVRAGFWSLLLRTGSRALGFVRTIVLARLLAPEDFGLFGIALVLLSIVERFSNTGLQVALIQRKSDPGEYIDTAWTMLAARGVALMLVLYVSAPYVAGFFEEPAAAPLIRALGVQMLLLGLSNHAVILLRRELQLRQEFLLFAGGKSTDLVVSVIAALVLRNAWALMIGLVASRIATLTLSYVLHPYRPRFRIDREKLGDLSHFARWIFLTNILVFLAYRGDNAVVGKMLGPALLGVYMLAYTISEVATVEISRSVAEVTLPLYMRVQDDVERLRRTFLHVIELLSCVTFPIAVGVALLAEPLVLTLLGSRWVAVASVLPMLAIAGSIRAVVINGTTMLYYGVGRSDFLFTLLLSGVIATYAVIFPLTMLFGLPGVGVAVLVGMLATIPRFLVQTRKTAGVRPGMLIRQVWPALVLAAATAASILLLGAVLPVETSVRLLLAVLVAAVTYLATAALLWRTAGVGPLRSVALLRSRQTAPAPETQTPG